MKGYFMEEYYDHWITNPLITPINKVHMFNEIIRISKEQAWNEGYQYGLANPYSPPSNNPYTETRKKA